MTRADIHELKGAGVLVPYDDGVLMKVASMVKNNHEDEHSGCEGEQRKDVFLVSIMSFMSMSIAIPSLHLTSIKHLIQPKIAALSSSTVSFRSFLSSFTGYCPPLSSASFPDTAEPSHICCFKR